MRESDLVGNALCLDFTNTVNVRPHPDRDSLATVEGLVAWGTAAGMRVLPAAAPGSGSASPTDLDAELESARGLREAVYRVFAATLSGGDPAAGDTETIMGTYAGAVAAARLRRHDSHYILHFPQPCTVRDLRWTVAASAVDLLLRGPLDRVGQCPSCGWLFLDTSRAGRRRWCSMDVCGSRAKARRYHRSRTAGGQAPYAHG